MAQSFRTELKLSPQEQGFYAELKVKLNIPIATLIKTASFAYLTDPNSFISCKGAGEGTWLKANRKTDKRLERFKCKNGNSFIWDWELDKVVKINIKK